MSVEPQLQRISNGQFELAVDPTIGRIVQYGPAGGPNILWINRRAKEKPSPFQGWLNWGGDKIWIWPEDDWAKWQNGLVAPPGDAPPSTHDVEIDGLKLTMTSPVIPALGLRIVREITLAFKGSQVKLVNRLERVAPAAPGIDNAPVSVGVWIVTQIFCTQPIFARLVPGAKPPGHAKFPAPDPWPNVKVDGDLVTLVRPGEPWLKEGFDADVLATEIEGLLFVARTPREENDQAGHEPFRRAQVFSDPDSSGFRPDSLPPYIEFEFTSPVRPLALHESVSLTVTWELHRLQPGGPSVADIVSN